MSANQRAHAPNNNNSKKRAREGGPRGAGAPAAKKQERERGAFGAPATAAASGSASSNNNPKKRARGSSFDSGYSSVAAPPSDAVQDAAETPPGEGKRSRRKAKRMKVEGSAPASSPEEAAPPAVQPEAAPLAAQQPAEAATPSADAYFASTVDEHGTFYMGPRLYKSLANLSTKYRESLIGLVTYVGGKKQSSSGRRDWIQAVRIVDPFNLKDFGDCMYAKEPGLMVTMFNHAAAWVPDLQAGDVIVLHEVKARMRDGKKELTGYSDQFQWAVFRSGSRTFDYSEPEGVLKSRQVSDLGKIIIYSPFLKELAEEVIYCEKLLDWWAEVQQERARRMGPVEQIGADSACATPARKPGRRQQLVQDVEVPPGHKGAYFDCTVLVLDVYIQGEIAYVHVTDFTGNDASKGLRPVEREWCPRGLRTKVLRIEFFGAQGLHFVHNNGVAKGQVWSIGNVRLKPANGDQYLEGLLMEVWKATRLEEKDAETNEHYRGLLARKEEFEKNNSSPYESAHTTLGDAEIDDTEVCILTCTVQILRINIKTSAQEGNQEGNLYVTDFTTRPDFAVWSVQLEATHPNAVLRIDLEGFQVEYAGHFAAGDIVAIKNLRVKKSDKGVYATLGGDTVLICKLGPEAQDSRFLELLRRKDGWQLPFAPRAESGATHIQVLPTFAQHRPAPAPEAAAEYMTIRQIQAHALCPAKFRLKAYVKDYDPLDLGESIIRLCGDCDETAGFEDLRCEKCGAGVERLHFQFDLRLELVDEPLAGDDAPYLIAEASEQWEALVEPETLVLEGDFENTVRDVLRPFTEHVGNETADTHAHGPMFEFVVMSIASRAPDGGRSYRILQASA